MTIRSNTVNKTHDNPYLIMPLAQVRTDARNGVRLACEAWRTRDPEGAARELGRIVEPPAAAGEPREQDQAERQGRIRTAVADFRAHGLKEVRQTRARRKVEETLFTTQTPTED